MEFTGKNVQEALQNGLNELGLSIDEVDYEIVSEGGGGIFGIGAKKAVVKIMPIDDELSVSDKENVRQDKSFTEVIKDTAENIAEKIEDFTDKVEEKIDEVEDKIEDVIEEKIESKFSKKDSDIEDSTKHIEFLTSFLDGLFERMDVKCSYVITQNDDILTVNISSNESGKLIGHRGETLDAIQYITRLAIHKQDLPYRGVVVQTENYREKREQTLRSLANRLAAKVERTGRRVTLEPMKPYERRIIHEELQNHDKVKTDSLGEEPNRYVVIELK